MPRINPIDPNQTEGKAKALLDGVQKALGMAPNLVRTLANSPAALEAHLGFGKALGGGSLGVKLREQINLAVSNANGCRYCTSAHTAIGRQLGLDDTELARNRRGLSDDPKVETALKLALAIVAECGWVSDDDIERVRRAGYSDGEIIEILAAVAQVTFMNYLDHIAEIEVDFPTVEVVEPVKEAAA